MADVDAPTAQSTRGAGEDLRDEERIHPSKLDDVGKMLVFKQWFRDDARHSSKWRLQAREDFNFIAGDQWSAEDEALLKSQMRQPIVFNRSLLFIKCIAGMEINSRHEINYLPRNTQTAQVSELLTGAGKWMADECGGEDEESISFQHANICGVGVLEHRLSFDDDAQGKYVEEAIDPLEFYWDCRAKKANLTDTRRRWRVRKIPVGDAMELFPDHTRDELDAAWALNDGPDSAEKTLEERRVRDENVAVQWSDREEVTILALQWYEKEPYWRVADPMTNSTAELSETQYQELTKRLATFNMPKLPAVRMQRKVFRQAFLGNVVLKTMKAPIPDRFSWTPITGEIHHTKAMFYGLVRVMRDPQMWQNKWLTQGLHILNSTAKGGILAEKGAFEDQAQAEESYAQPNAITWMADKALQGPNPMVMPKPGAGTMQGYMELMGVAVSAMRDVTGINAEQVGLEDQNQPGILAAHRKQAGMTVLATMFDSLRRTRKEIGHIRLYYIQNFLSDGRLIRIVGQDGAKAIPLVRDKCLGTYDVVVDDAPTSPNQKEANWEIILSILPAFKDQLMAKPQIMLTVLEYSPLPSRLVEALKEALNQPDPQGQRQQQLMEEKVVAGINKDQSTAEMQNAKAGATGATALYDIAMARNLLTKSNHQLDAAQAAMDVAHRAAQVDTEHAKQQNLAADTHGKFANAHAAVAGADAAHQAAHADIAATHASTLATHVGAVKDGIEAAHTAMQPIPHHKDAFPPPVPKGKAV